MPKKTTQKAKKKKTTTRKTAKRASSARKQEENQVAILESRQPRKPVKHAKELHAKQVVNSQAKPYPTLEKTDAKHLKVRHFSFPTALSQVRDNLDGSQKPQPIKKRTRAEMTQKVDAGHYRSSHSPYVLDLKKGMTMNLQGWLDATKRTTAPAPQQEVLSIFDEGAQRGIASELALWGRSLRRFVSPTKTINLAPIEHRFEPGYAAKKVWRRLTWRWKSARQSALQKRLIKENQYLQQAIQLPPDIGAPRKTNLLSRETRNGRPISVKSLSSHIGKKQNIQIRHFSSFVGRQQPKEAATGFSWRATLVPFATLAMILILPFATASIAKYYQTARTQVLGATNSAVQQLQLARDRAQQFDFIKASDQFALAGQAFSAAGALLKNEYGSVTRTLSFLPVIGNKIQAAEDLLDGGNELSAAAASFSQGIAVFTDPNHFLADQALTYKLEYFFVHLQDARPILSSAATHLASLQPGDLPADTKEDVATLQKLVPVVQNYVEETGSLMEPVLQFLGHYKKQRYLIIFQNNTELRATGGFFGSLALVDIDRGEIENIEIPGGGPYDFQGSLFENYQAPRALHLINPRWELQDANWFFDWPTSARKVSSLYEKAGGPSVDGVIAINTNVLEQLLEVTGPIKLDEYGTEITAANFRETLQNHVEFEYDKELNQPKKIIADLAPVLLARLKDLPRDQYLPVGQTLSNLLKNREVLLYSRNEEAQAGFQRLGWTGEVVENDADYLAVVHTNLAGGKTDGVIKDNYHLNVHVNELGETTNTLTIRRTHTGEKGIPLIGVRNVDYLRIYVPAQAELVSATGFHRPPQELFDSPDASWMADPDLLTSEAAFIADESSGTEIYTETGKRVFANWLQVDPGQTIEAKVVYKSSETLKTFELPERDSSWMDWFTGETAAPADKVRFYQLYWQKQSGAWNPDLEITVNYPQQWNVRSDTPIAATTGRGVWSAEAPMLSDSVWNLVFY